MSRGFILQPRLWWAVASIWLAGVALAAGLLRDGPGGARIRHRFISGDGYRYYAYARSLVFDGDLDFTNEYRDHTRPPEAGRWLLRQRTPRNLPANVFPVGPALLWIPSIALLHELEPRASRAAAREGYERPYQVAVFLTAVLWSLLGLSLCAILALEVAEPAPAALATLALATATMLPFYALYQPAYSHAYEFAWVAALLVASLKAPAPTGSARAGALGWIGGMTLSIRWQTLPFLIFPLGRILRGSRPQRGRSLLAFIAGLSVGFLPQLVVWQRLYGQAIVIPQGSGFLNWRDAHWLEVLLSARNGLFAYHPLLLAGLVGWLLIARRRPRLALAAFFVLVLEVWISAAARDWWGGNGFGMRRLTNTLPLLGLGWAALLERWWSRAGLRWTAAAVVAAAGLWNWALIATRLDHRFQRTVVIEPAVVLERVRDLMTTPSLLELGALGTAALLLLAILGPRSARAPRP